MTIQKFRKKPVTIEAAKLSFDSVVPLMDWIPQDQAMFLVSPGRVSVHIQTLEGTMVAREGDWIIRGVNGEFYPCKPDIFDKTYEPES